MFVPLKDDTPLHVIRFQYVTVLLIVVNVLVFLLTGPLAGAEALAGIAAGFGVVPAQVLHGASFGGGTTNPVAEPLTLLTYMFLHGGWVHLLSNMVFLWVFADNIEDAFGYAGFAIFYVLCGVMAALVHIAMSPGSSAPLIGASGAVSGVLGAYMLLYPRARVWILLFIPVPVKIPALWVLGGWIALQVFSAAVALPQSEGIAWWTHIGGFFTGLILTAALRSRLQGI